MGIAHINKFSPMESHKNSPSPDIKKKINEEITIDRAWLIIKNNAEYISPKLRCPICLDLVNEPIQCKKCKKIYCKDCYSNWEKQTKVKKCLGGTDGHDFIYQEPEKWILNYLNTLKIYCVYKNCEKAIEYQNFFKHILNCSHKKDGYKELKRPNKEIFDYSDITIFIKTLDDINLTFNVKLYFKVKEIKKMFQDKINLDYDEIVLSFGGSVLKDDKTLETYNIQKNSTIFQIGRLKGGILI